MAYKGGNGWKWFEVEERIGLRSCEGEVREARKGQSKVGRNE